MLHCEYCYFLGSGAAPCCICGSDSFLTDDCLRVTVVGTYDDLGAVSAPLELLRQLLGDSMFRRSDSRNSGLIEIGQLPGYRPDKIGLAIRLVEVEPDLPAADIQALANSDATAILMPLQLDRRFDEVVGFIRSPEAKAALTSRVVWTALVKSTYPHSIALETHPYLWSTDRYEEAWQERRAEADEWFASAFGFAYDWFCDEICPHHAQFALLHSTETELAGPTGNDAVFLEAILRAASEGARQTSLGRLSEVVASLR
jgi:hypothetical protein